MDELFSRRQWQQNRDQLWDHLLEEHKLILTDAQLDTIIHLSLMAADETDYRIAKLAAQFKREKENGVHPAAVAYMPTKSE